MRSEEEIKLLCRYNPVKAAKDFVELQQELIKRNTHLAWMKEEYNKCCKECHRLRGALKQLQGESQ